MTWRSRCVRVGGGGRCGEWRGAGANAAFPRFNNARPACADESRGERGGFCMGFVPASSRDRLTWTGNESRGINAGKSPHTRVVFCRKIARVCRNITYSPESRKRSLVTQTLTFHSRNLRRKRLGSTIGSASDSSSEGCEFDSCLGHAF